VYSEIRILHDAIKTIKVFPFSLKKEQNLVSLKKNVFFSKKTGGLFFFLKKLGFFSNLLQKNLGLTLFTKNPQYI